GCGKSVLSAAAIEDIKRLCFVEKGHTVAYFYFTFSDPKKQDLRNMLRSIIGQLLLASSDIGLPDEIIKLYRSSKASGMLPDIKDLQVALSHITGLSRKTFIILDALDEFPKATRGRLLSWIGELRADPDAGSLSLLMTSRPETDIAKSLELPTTFAIPLQSKFIDPDIQSYIESCLDRRPGFTKFTEVMKGEIKERLVSGSQG
ncbi:unnamed protein product, partial [Tuber aestivum]